MKHSTYQQIIDWNQRRGGHPRLGMELVTQIDSLQAEGNKVGALDSVYLEFVPIRLVTTLEVFLRGVIGELVDKGEPYFSRAEKFTKGAKIDLAFAAHVDRGELTIGDFIAHAVPLNSAESAVAALGTLIDGYVPKLKSSHPRWSEEIDTWPLPPILADYDAMMAALSRLYTVRHILTHELPAERVLDPIEVPTLIASCRAFVEATDWVVVECLHGSVPKTQMSMNLQAAGGLRNEEERLAARIERVKALPGINVAVLEAVQAVWQRFADAQADLVASQVEGGSMHSMIWAGEKESLVKDRIEQLERMDSQWMN